MVLISGALSVSIYSFSTSADLQVCIPSDSPQGDLFMLWVPSVYNGPINHLVPLMERQICPQVDVHCTLGRFCSFDGNGAEGEKVRCSLCQRPYHLRCAFLDRPPESWQCYCHQREDTLSRLDFKCAFSFLPRSIMLCEKISQAVESVKTSPMDGSGFY